MALNTIYPNGTATIDIPATESIAISNYGGGIAKIFYLVTNTNQPDAFQFQQTLENSGVVLGAFANGQTVKIEAGRSTVIYDVGASPDTGIGDADTLGGQLPSYYTNASNISSGTLAAARLPATYALDSAVVHNTGAESVSGKKTWNSSQSHANGAVIYIQQADTTEKSAIYMTAADYVWLGSSTNPMRHNFSSLLATLAAAPTAKTTDATLTTGEIEPGIITVNNGAAGTTTLTLPLASAMDSGFAYVGDGYGINFSVINISTVAAEDCTIATNTGWTSVGSMVVESNDNDRANSTGQFRARKTGTAAWTLYRIS